MKTDGLFPGVSYGLERDLRRLNPWWHGGSLQPLPTTRRHLVAAIQRRLKSRLAPIVVVRGPRQIGKTTAQLHVIQDLLNSGTPPECILRVQWDELPGLDKQEKEPILRIADWYEIFVLKQTLNDAAHQGKKTYLFFDEIQNLKNWAPQLKFLVDASTTQVCVTGSSALRIEQGRDSLAGRITTIEAGLLSLTEIAQFYDVDLGKPFIEDNGLEPLTGKPFWQELAGHGARVFESRDFIFDRFSERGGYPLVHSHRDSAWGALADQLNETVIKRVIQHDLRIGERGRKRDAPLLEELFRLACRYVGQAPSPGSLAREAHRALEANVGSQRVAHYLAFLADTLLLRLIQPLEIRLKRKRGNPKICLADHGLRASWLQEVIPLSPSGLAENPHLTDLAGHIAESIVGATLSTISSLDLAHLPERNDEPEVDFVLTVGTKRIPLEVKYRRHIDPLRDTEGLRTFIEKTANNASFGIVISQTDEPPVDDPRIVTLPLSTLMLLR
jgi:predicted AAA+ superfamily ATPase